MTLKEMNMQDLKKKMSRRTQRQTVMKLIYQMSITNDFSPIKDIYIDYKKESEKFEINSNNIDSHKNTDNLKILISNFSASSTKGDFDIEEVSSGDGRIIYENKSKNECVQDDLNNYTDIDYIQNMTSFFIENLNKIDEDIEHLLFDNWKINRLSKIDLAILRTAILDIKYMNIPYKVSINEALDLAKEYSDEKSSSFINGVLKEYVKNFLNLEAK